MSARPRRLSRLVVDPGEDITVLPARGRVPEGTGRVRAEGPVVGHNQGLPQPGSLVTDPTLRATVLLRRARDGDAAAADELLPLLYDELRRIAVAHMAGERDGHTLQPTALVHEAWMRLADAPEHAEDKNHFLSLAARVMRRVLVDHARTRKAAKRGGEQQRLPLDDALALYEQRDLDVLALDDALAGLEQMDAELARLVELRFFGGLSNGEAAEALGSSLRSVERSWATARTWLRDSLSR